MFGADSFANDEVCLLWKPLYRLWDIQDRSLYYQKVLTHETHNDNVSISFIRMTTLKHHLALTITSNSEHFHHIKGTFVAKSSMYKQDWYLDGLEKPKAERQCPCSLCMHGYQQTAAEETPRRLHIMTPQPLNRVFWSPPVRLLHRRLLERAFSSLHRRQNLEQPQVLQ